MQMDLPFARPSHLHLSRPSRQACRIRSLCGWPNSHAHSPPHVQAARSHPSRHLSARTHASTKHAPSAPQAEPRLAAQELLWPWRWGSKVRYFRAGSDDGPAVLLVHGFGVGAWHYERNLEELVEAGYTVYSVDLLGQGCSWPTLESLECGLGSEGQPGCADGPLRFSIMTWTEQLADFTQQVIGRPAFLAGNSLGGYVAASLAATRPELVQGLVLLNSTPFWSFRPPREQAQGIWQLLEFDGQVPAPEGLKRVIERWWWNNLRSRETVESMLSLVYAHKPSVTGDPSLAERIIEATEHPAALDAFVSIVASPKSPQPFNVLLCTAKCPICLVYGRQDPWVKPAWGQRAFDVMKRHGTPAAMYLELDGAGHCPHHEAPLTTNRAMKACFAHMAQLNTWREQQQQGSNSAPSPHAPPPPIPVGDKVPVTEADGRVVVIEHVDGQPRDLSELFFRLAWWFVDAFQGRLAQPVSKQEAQQQRQQPVPE